MLKLEISRFKTQLSAIVEKLGQNCSNAYVGYCLEKEQKETRQLSNLLTIQSDSDGLEHPKTVASVDTLDLQKQQRYTFESDVYPKQTTRRAFKDSPALAIADRDVIQKASSGQSNSVLWNLLRKNRLTASMAGRVYKSKKPLTSSKLWPLYQYQSEAMLHGKMFESVAIEAISQKMDLEIFSSGLWIDLERPHLAASPDGLLYKNNQLHAVVEVKCPFTAHMGTIDTWSRQYKTCLSINPTRLNQRHDYYFQMQMQMGVTGVKKGLFAVYTGLDVYTEWIPFDPVLWSTMVEKMDNVWYRVKTEEGITEINLAALAENLRDYDTIAPDNYEDEQFEEPVQTVKHLLHLGIDKPAYYQ